MKYVAVFFTIASLCAAPQAFAERPSRQIVSVSASAGLPDLIGLRVGYEGAFPVRFSLGFGLLPVNGLINSFIPLSRQPVSFSTGGPYNLYPTATYSLTSVSLDARYHVASSGFFISAVLANLYFSNTFNASLRDESTGATLMSSAVNGGANIIQPMLGLGIGYEFAFRFGMIINIMAGAAYPIATIATTSLGGTAAQAAPALSGGDASFNAAKTAFTNAINQGVATYRAFLPVFPMLTLQLGWVF